MGGCDRKLLKLLKKGKKIIEEKSKSDIKFDERKKAVDEKVKFLLYDKYPVARLERLKRIVEKAEVNAHLQAINEIIVAVQEEELNDEATFVKLDSLLKIYGDELDKEKIFSRRVLKIFVKEENSNE